MFWACLTVAGILAGLWLEEKSPGLANLERLLAEADQPDWLRAGDLPIWAQPGLWQPAPLVSPADEAVFPGLFGPTPPSSAPLLKRRARREFLNEAESLGLRPRFIPEADEPVIVAAAWTVAATRQFAENQWLRAIQTVDSGRSGLNSADLRAARANYLARIGRPADIWETA